MAAGNRTGSCRNRATDDAAFRRLVQEAKDRRRLSDIIGRHTKLKKRGAVEMVGLCPFHSERTGSFEVNDARGLYHCHGCGASGDHYRFLMEREGMSFRAAYEALTDNSFPVIDPADRARQADEDAAARAASITDAKDLWAAGVDIVGTVGETYLRDVRGISMLLPDTIRFGHVPARRNPETGYWERTYPAILCACTGGDGEILGLQRIFLTDDGRAKRWGKRSKLSLGRPKGAAFKIGGRSDEVVLCEGPEDGLTLAQELPGRRTIWVALGTAMMPHLQFPVTVSSVVIAGQNDKAGRAAVEDAGEALLAAGYAVRSIWPDPAFKDWNDMLRGVRA